MSSGIDIQVWDNSLNIEEPEMYHSTNEEYQIIEDNSANRQPSSADRQPSNANFQIGKQINQIILSNNGWMISLGWQIQYK